MFDKYPMVHCEVLRPITSRTEADVVPNLAQSVSNPAIVMPPSEAFERPFAGLRGERYRITGSFDYLLPPAHPDPAVLPLDPGLALQMFIVMNCTPAYYTHRDYYDSVMISYTYSGEGELVYDGRTYSLTPETGFIIDCRKPHDYRTTGDHWEHADLHFWGTRAADLCLCAATNGLVTFQMGVSVYNHLMEELLDSYTFFSDLRSQYVEDDLSHLFFSILRSAEKDGVSRIPLTYKYMIRYMDSNYMNDLSLDSLSEMFHVSKFHMSREFRKYTGVSPGEYLITLRANHALLLLAQSDFSVEKIALQSGFGNMSNFIAQIKKRTGMTPSDFRKYVRG